MSTSYYVENTEYDDIPAAESVLADADALIAAGVVTATAAAAASATNAASSATSAAATLASFNGVYYGALAADPTLDPNGNAPNAGDFYYNTAGTALKVYSGSAWQSYSPVAGAPSDADYLVKTANGGLSAERVVTDTATLTWDWATAGQAKANVIVTFDGLAPTTTRGDLIARDATTNARLAIGAANRVLRSNGTDPSWGQIVNADITNATIDLTSKVTGILPSANGGNGNGFFAVSGPATSAKTFTFPNASDTVACLGQSQNWTAAQTYPLTTLTDAANISWTASSAQKAKVTLGGNRTMNAVTGAVEGSTYLLWVLQDATGSRTITWTTTGAGSFDFGADGAPTLTTTASRADLLAFEAISIGGTLKLRFTGLRKGFA